MSLGVSGARARCVHLISPCVSGYEGAVAMAAPRASASGAAETAVVASEEQKKAADDGSGPTGRKGGDGIEVEGDGVARRQRG